MITIVGAGFSGLSLAYHLRRLGVKVRVLEKGERAGGLVSTSRTDFGLAESAANAIMCDVDMERLFDNLNVPFAGRRPERKNRYIFWKKATRWPLGVVTSARLAWLAGQVRLGNAEVLPREFESIHDWTRRVLNAEFEERLLTPALQGVFAGDPKLLSANLTLKALFAGRAPSGRFRGSVAPAEGMGQLMQALAKRLQDEGVEIEYKSDFLLSEHLESPVVMCTSAWTAAEIMQETHPRLAEDLRHCESLPLVSVTAYFEPSAADLKGFGCLFPVGQGFFASGALFNSCIFEGRSASRSETWIFGGALQLSACKWSDEEIRAHLIKDRARVMPGASLEPLGLKINRWPRAIPHYTVQWEKFLKEMRVPQPLHLHGNYLGAIGLAKIHRRSIDLAAQLKDTYGA